MQTLIRKEVNGDIPIARLIRKNDVYYIHPLIHPSNTSHIAAPGIARVPKSTNAQRWHQRLGHTGQKILKKTAQCSKGMEGLDIGEFVVPSEHGGNIKAA
ncbi:hypothetical protein K3495_g16776 [Podosphaera aphanis]|nr:hypothetical protein K3495_g16776 [Podosphaera aphanis]